MCMPKPGPWIFVLTTKQAQHEHGAIDTPRLYHGWCFNHCALMRVPGLQQHVRASLRHTYCSEIIVIPDSFYWLLLPSVLVKWYPMSLNGSSWNSETLHIACKRKILHSGRLFLSLQSSTTVTIWQRRPPQWFYLGKAIHSTSPGCFSCPQARKLNHSERPCFWTGSTHSTMSWRNPKIWSLHQMASSSYDSVTTHH